MNELKFNEKFNITFSTKNKILIKRGAELYVSKRLCNEYIRSAKENDLAILGIEGFILNNNFTHPNIHEIADFSIFFETNWNDYINNRAIESHEFINKICFNSDSNYYCFVLINQNEFQQIMKDRKESSNNT